MVVDTGSSSVFSSADGRLMLPETIATPAVGSLLLTSSSDMSW